MLISSPATWTVRGATFALWAVAAASAAYWALHLTGGQGPVSAAAPALRPVAPVDPAAIARLLGSTPLASAAAGEAPVATLSSRFQLVGVAAGATSGRGAAVISVDGKPARPFRVGMAVDEGLLLQSVRGRRATLAAQPDGPPVLTLELPAHRSAQAASAAPR